MYYYFDSEVQIKTGFSICLIMMDLERVSAPFLHVELSNCIAKLIKKQ